MAEDKKEMTVQKNWEKFDYFDSVPEFLKAVEEETPEHKKEQYGRTWTGNMSHDEAVELTRKGDISAVEKANAILEKVDGSILQDGLRERWITAPAGAFANVPAFLANAPETMFQKANARGQKKSVNVYFCGTSASGISAEDLFKRGTVVLALVMQLSRLCDVNLYFYSALDGNNHIVRLASPMVLSESAHVLTCTAFDRCLSHGREYAHGYCGSWAKWVEHGDDEHNIKAVKLILGLKEDDIVFPSVHMEHFQKGFFTEPVKHINEILSKYKS
jgi:hypothetical protein